MSTGWESRLQILRRRAEDDILAPLRTHGWTAEIEQEVERGEYIIVAAERGGHSHKVAILYSSGTGNGIYRQLEEVVEHIFYQGQPYEVEQLARGVAAPVSSSDDFYAVLMRWNADSAEGKFAPATQEDEPTLAARPEHLVLLAEQPIDAIWLRIRQLQSITLAKKTVAGRARATGVSLCDEDIRSKAEGIAYALRNASDYYQLQPQSVSQRILNLYYGTLSFAFAEMLSSPNGASALGDIEDSTKQGHGLYTLDGDSDRIEKLVIGVLATGFFSSWAASMGLSSCEFPKKKARRYDDLTGFPDQSWLTLEELFSRVPEVADLHREIFDSPPAWVYPVYDQEANPRISLTRNNTPRTRSYVQLVDESARMAKETIASFPGPISEISEVSSDGPGRHCRDAVDHLGHEYWWGALPVHHSPFTHSALILPVFGEVGEFRAICFVLLYALSIVVRYRPSLWRRVQEGDLDHMRVLIEAFLAVAERTLPEQFLEKITGQRIAAKQPGSLF